MPEQIARGTFADEETAAVISEMQQISAQRTTFSPYSFNFSITVLFQSKSTARLYFRLFQQSFVPY